MKEIDFENDIKLELQRLAKVMGFKISSSGKLDQMLADYLNVYSKRIFPKKRIIRANPEFVKEIFFHPKRKEIEYIYSVARAGGNLNPFQSERLFETKFHDHLRNEWNIFHFHLSTNIQRSNFVKRVDTLLFAYVDENQIIFLGIDTHKAFSDIKWLKILHMHFQDVLLPFKIKDNEDLNVLYPMERDYLWLERVSFGMIRIGDAIYQHPGFGQATSGHNILLVRNVIGYTRWIYELSEQVKKYYNQLCESLGTSVDYSEFKIVIGDTTFELIEETQKIRILEFPQLLEFK